MHFARAELLDVERNAIRDRYPISATVVVFTHVGVCFAALRVDPAIVTGMIHERAVFGRVIAVPVIRFLTARCVLPGRKQAVYRRPIGEALPEQRLLGVEPLPV